ncbi:MAG: 16S rRNA (guanine(527)-N(7))-methyltransferase RsmG [Bacteroidota bacterium]
MELITKYFNEFTTRQLQQFAALEELYKDWNSKINVISRKDIDSLYQKHVLHALSIAAVFDCSPGTEIMDLGTGGGFPGIPLAIFFPEARFWLVDSIGKKLKVVTAIADALDLKNLQTQHTRAEDIRDRKFDAVVSRAVAPLNDLWKWSRPLIRKKKPAGDAGNELTINGLICLKGGDLAPEIAESTCRPRSIEIYSLFKEDFFKEKYLLHVTV